MCHALTPASAEPLTTGPRRRDVLAGFACLGAAFIAGPAARAGEAPRLRLRVLETSDLHTAVMDWDYYRAKQDLSQGVVRTASLVRAARAEAPNCLLFDNGDLIQGNPLGDYVARPGGLAAGERHPLVAVLEALGTDAATVGNHEFNFGLDFLERSLAGAKFPFVCANIERADGSDFLPKTVVLERTFVDANGAAHTLRIGVVGFVTPQIMNWDRSKLEGRLKAFDIVDAAHAVVPDLRARADIVIGLCHAGIGGGPRLVGEENAALHLAEAAGLDIVLTGHSHRVFPGPDYAKTDHADATRGTLAGVPAAMPGFWGSHLGVLDLDLVRDGERWKLADFHVETRPIARRIDGKLAATVEPDAAIAALIKPAHEATKAWIETPVGRFAERVQSYFVWTGEDAPSNVVHAAQIDYAKRMLAGTPHAGLPILSAVAPFKTGYTPDWFVDVAAGPVALRDAADLYTYPNTLAVVRVTGATVREWLEHGARVFNTLKPGAGEPQPLLDGHVPSYNFDAIAGVTYGIDPTRPARTDQNGTIVTPDSGRIVDLSFEGKPIDPAAEFLVVTNNYRADGGGKFPGLGGDNVVLRAPDLSRDVVVAWIKAHDPVSVAATTPWRYAVTGGPIVVGFDTGTAARALVGERPKLKLGEGAKAGYVRVTFEI